MSYLSRHLERVYNPPRDWQCADCGYRCTNPTCESDMTGDHVNCGSTENGWHHREEKAAEVDTYFGFANPNGSGEGNWSAAFHDECGFAWLAHDNTVLTNVLPFGCPTETTAREAWGR